MRFFLRYVVVYVAVALGLLALVAYTGFEAGMGSATWIAVAVFAAWMLVYHPLLLRSDYRRVSRLVAQLRAGELDGKIDADRVRESVQRLAVSYGNVPEIIAAVAVRRILTDDVVNQFAARLQARRQGQAT